MNDLDRFAAAIDGYVKRNKEMQPEQKNLVTVELEFLMALANSTINSDKKQKLERKITVIKEVLDL